MDARGSAAHHWWHDVSATSTRRELAAEPSLVWAVLAGFDRIADWAPNVDHSCSLSSQSDGVGAIRRVQVGRMALVETVTAWEPGAQLAYRVDGLPARLGTISNAWHLAPSAGGGSTVIVTSTVDTGPRPPQQAIGRLIARKLASSSEVMLDGLADHLDRAVAPS